MALHFTKQAEDIDIFRGLKATPDAEISKKKDISSIDTH